MDIKLEVVVLPVSDVDRAKEFYNRLGWREDIDFVHSPEYRVVQFTPPGSQASIILGTGITSSAPGSYQGLQLVVTDIVAAREELAANGIDVSEIFHDETGIFHHAGTAARVAGPDPKRGSYGSFLSFEEPRRQRLDRARSHPEGAGPVSDVPAPETDRDIVLRLLKDTAAAHGIFEKEELGGVFDAEWPEWYSTYFTEKLHAEGFKLVP